MRKLAVLCCAVAIGAVWAGASAAPGSAASTTKVKFVFNFAPGGYDANLIAGKAKGFFEKQGLDVSFITPATGADPAKLIANGAANIGLVHSPDVILARAKGLPIVSIGTTHQFGTLELLCPASQGIKSLKDLEGHTVGLTGIPSDKVMFEQMLKANNIDESKIKVVVAGFAGVPQLLTGRIDCYEAISWYEPILYNQKLKKPLSDKSTYTEIQYYRHGIPRFYTFGIVTSESYAKSHADVVKRFMKAWSQALQWSIAHPDAASAALTKAYPSVDKPSSLAIWKASTKVATSAETKAHCLGWQSPSVWSAQESFLRKNKLISKPVSIKTAMTNSFLPCS
ncbi:MAG TPA: ABC transporter substrate-binding protein [Solirubrobacteraceae bacterium]|jgi:putative hydroxymethylpyrimidine transport system substrate-binding protein|nr:ABC transporter substrate-binding protein [Solirubrobacteraceae bacterium]